MKKIEKEKSTHNFVKCFILINLALNMIEHMQDILTNFTITNFVT